MTSPISATVSHITGAIRPHDFEALLRRYTAARRDVNAEVLTLLRAIRAAEPSERREHPADRAGARGRPA